MYMHIFFFTFFGNNLKYFQIIFLTICTMNFGEILKPIRTPNSSYINGFSHFILGTYVLRIR